MRALVVYESMYGNTKRVAEAIADGVAKHMAVEAVEVSLAPNVIDPSIDLLLVGGPTHVHGMTSAFTRTQAIKEARTQIVSEGIGLREWLDRVHLTVTSTPAAAFDTRIRKSTILTGSAAHGYAKRLRALGFRVLEPAESFFISTKAPQDDALLEGELERARIWGTEIAKHVDARVAVPIG
jgi:Flavodoxin